MMRKSCVLNLLAAALLAGQVHQSPMAGKWFPPEPPELERLVEQVFDVAGQRTGSAPPRKNLRALVVPHAGFQFSGIVAASAYRTLGTPKNVILLGFSHSRLVRGVVAPAVDRYATPLGEIQVNREAFKKLGFPETPEDSLCDHSLENQLPFLQRFASGSGLIPLYVGELSPNELAAAARKLAERIDQGDVVIASSDFTHYGEPYHYTPWPNDKDLPRRLFHRAVETFELLGALDLAAFDRFVAATGENLCGRGPVRLLMATLGQLKEETYLVPLDYLASGELTRDYSVSVGYGALAFYPSFSFAVNEEDQKKLLSTARRTLDGFLAGRKERASLPSDGLSPDLQQRTGIFVTVKKNGKLRGCVGSLFANLPLHEAVADRTLAAASQDPRFRPVTAEEAPLTLEISLLTPLRKITNWRQFRAGQGAVIVQNGRSSTLLPQIAAENGWSAEQFLENLSRKAGLPPKAYRDSAANLYVYSAQVFAEPGAHAASASGGRQ